MLRSCVERLQPPMPALLGRVPGRSPRMLPGLVPLQRHAVGTASAQAYEPFLDRGEERRTDAPPPMPRRRCPAAAAPANGSAARDSRVGRRAGWLRVCGPVAMAAPKKYPKTAESGQIRGCQATWICRLLEADCDPCANLRQISAVCSPRSRPRWRAASRGSSDPHHPGSVRPSRPRPRRPGRHRR